MNLATINRYAWNNKISSSNFGSSETRVIFIGEYVSTIRSVHPTSIEMGLALFSSTDPCGAIRIIHPTLIAMKFAFFHQQIRVEQSY